MTETVFDQGGEVRSIWYSDSGFSPLSVAARLGWIQKDLAADGIALKSVRRDGDSAERLSHYHHHLANSFRQGGSVAAIWARARGVKTRVIGLNWLDEYQAVIALPDSDIRTVKDLRGRRLGLTSRVRPVDHMQAASLRGFAAALELGGLDWRRHIGLVLLPETKADAGDGQNGANAKPDRSGSNMVDALVKGEVDAIFVRGPRGIEITDELRARIIVAISAHPDPLVRANCGGPQPITVDSALLESRPDLVGRVLSQIAAVGPWAEANPAEAAKYFARQSGNSLFAVQKAYKGNLSKMLHTTLDGAAVAGLEAFKNFLLEAEFVDEDFDVGAWIAPEPLAGLRRSRRRLAA